MGTRYLVNQLDHLIMGRCAFFYNLLNPAAEQAPLLQVIFQ
jgi:hypothetical protein